MQERIELEKVTVSAELLLPQKAIESLKDIITSSRPTIGQFLAFRRHVKPALNKYRTYTALGATWRRYFRELAFVGRYLNKKYLHTAVPFKRVNTRGGLLVAILGCDGSGKSTQIQKVQKWLSWKLDVMPVYLGSGDGSSSLLRWPMKWVAKMLRNQTGLRADKYQGISQDKEHEPGKRTVGARLKTIAKVLWALALAHEKSRKLHKANMARNRGMVVICDRYPQNQIMGFNDGPLLSHWLDHPSRILQAIGRWESCPYLLAEEYPPDVVIKLMITPDIAVKRKKDMSLEESRQRVEAIKTLHYGPGTKTVTIDANQPIDEVLLEVKRCLWQEF